MKTTAAPHEFENITGLNLTQEQLDVFMEHLNKHLTKTNLHNKTFANETFDDSNSHQAVNCDEYCDSDMRHFFEEYKHYHGYVTLVVSIPNLA